METIETTNSRLAKIRVDLKEMVTWAYADADSSKESGATEQADDDEQRARLLHQALKLLEMCDR